MMQPKLYTKAKTRSLNKSSVKNDPFFIEPSAGNMDSKDDEGEENYERVANMNSVKKDSANYKVKSKKHQVLTEKDKIAKYKRVINNKEHRPGSRKRKKLLAQIFNKDEKDSRARKISKRKKPVKDKKRISSVKVNSPKNKVEKELHPSWVAKKKMHLQKITGVHAKHVVFDSD